MNLNKLKSKKLKNTARILQRRRKLNQNILSTLNPHINLKSLALILQNSQLKNQKPLYLPKIQNQRSQKKKRKQTQLK